MGFTNINTLPFLLLLSFLSFGVLASAIALSIKAYKYQSRSCATAAVIMFMEIIGIIMILCDSVFGKEMIGSFSELLVPVHLIEGYFALFPILAYIMELKRPGWFSWKKIPMLIPIVLVSLLIRPYLNEYTHLYSIGDIFLYGEKFEVILRIILGLLYIIYGTFPFLFPGKDKESGLPKLNNDALQLITLILTFTFFVGMQLNVYPVAVFHSILLFSYNVFIVYTELRIRIPAKIDSTPQKPVHNKNDHPYFDNPDIWMNPEMTSVELSRIMGTNQKYLSAQIKECGYSGFSDMINHKRVEYICEKLSNCKGARADIIQLMYDAGFRSRSSASSEFKRITGCTPSEYLKKFA